MARRLFFLALSVALLLGGCRDAAGPPRPAAALPIGTLELAPAVGASQDVVVRVTDAQGRGVSNVQVGWTVAAGGGAVAPSASRTDAQGDARTTWTLGTVPGANVLKAAPSGLPEVTFSVAANPGPPASMAAASAVPGQAPAGTAVAPAPTVVVRDGYGNAVPGAVVAFTVEAGAGSVAAAVVNADADGRASAAWTLGTAVGGNTLVARTGALEPVSFSVQALPGEAARIDLGGRVRGGKVADGDDAVANDGDVGDTWRVAAAVVDGTAADDDVVLGGAGRAGGGSGCMRGASGATRAGSGSICSGSGRGGSGLRGSGCGSGCAGRSPASA